MSSSMPKVSPTESFLRYLALPEDESEFVELQHCAVVLVSHLDRLAAPYLPMSSNQKVHDGTVCIIIACLQMSPISMLYLYKYQVHIILFSGTPLIRPCRKAGFHYTYSVHELYTWSSQ